MPIDKVPVLTPVSAPDLAAEQNKTPVAEWTPGWTPEKIAKWEKMILDGARNRHLNTLGQNR
jgi:hypothetical protein